MARKMTEWPSKRGPITKIMPSDGCIGDTVPLAVGKWYEFHEFGWYMGNVGSDFCTRSENAINWTRLSCRKFRNNAVRLQLHALAYNPGNFMRTLALPKEVEHWSMTTLRDKLVKIGAKVVRHGRYVTFQLAEVAVPRDLFRKILSLIDDLRRRPAPA